MGFHICEYCPTGGQGRYSHLSSGDVTLIFDSGRIWGMPDMIFHYIADHSWQPPAEFVDDVMSHHFIGGQRLQTRSPATSTRIGYLSGPFTQGPVPDGFVEKLESLMHQAASEGHRVQQYRTTQKGV